MKKYQRPIKHITCYKCGVSYSDPKDRKRHLLGLIGLNCHPKYRKLASFKGRIYRNRKVLFEKWYNHLKSRKIDFNERKLYRKIFGTPLNRSGLGSYFCTRDMQYCSSKQALITHYCKQHREPYKKIRLREYMLQIGAQKLNYLEKLKKNRKQNKISLKLYRKLSGKANLKLCLYCEKATFIRSSNMKRHVDTMHPQVQIFRQRRLLAVALPPPLIGPQNYQYQPNLYTLLLAIYQIFLVKRQRPLQETQMIDMAFKWRAKVCPLSKSWSQKCWLKMINQCCGFWTYNQPNVVWDFVSVRKTIMLDRCYLAKTQYWPYIQQYDNDFIQMRLGMNRSFDQERQQQAQWKQLRIAFRKNQMLKSQQKLQAADLGQLQDQQRQLMWMQAQQNLEKEKRAKEKKKQEQKTKQILKQLKQKVEYDEVQQYKKKHGIDQIKEIVIPPPRQRGRRKKGKSTGRPKKIQEIPQEK